LALIVTPLLVVGDKAMPIFNLWELIEVGMSLRLMLRANKEWPTKEAELLPVDQPFAIECLSQFSESLSRISLNDPKNQIQKQLGNLDKLTSRWIEREMSDVNGDVEFLREVARELKALLLAVGTQYAVFVPTELGVEARKYADGIERMFGNDIWGQLPGIARKDFHQAGVCIAFGAYTAAACLLVRATEAALRCYYCAMTNEEAPDDGMWGRVMNKLIKKVEAGTVLVSKETMGDYYFIRSLGSQVRNPTMHPQFTYDDFTKVDEALEKCRTAVQRMAASLERENKTFLDGWDLAKKTMEIHIPNEASLS
jgi:hypothetical protein